MVRKTSPTRKVKRTSPTRKVKRTSPTRKVKRTSPTRKVKRTSPKRKVRRTSPKRKSRSRLNPPDTNRGQRRDGRRDRRHNPIESSGRGTPTSDVSERFLRITDDLIDHYMKKYNFSTFDSTG